MLPKRVVKAHASDTVLCYGETLRLWGSGAKLYDWSHGVINNVSFLPVITTQYFVTGYDSNRCENTDRINVTVLPNRQVPEIRIAPKPNGIEAGVPTTLVASLSDTLTNYRLEWYVNGLLHSVGFSPNDTLFITPNLYDSIYCILFPTGCFVKDAETSNVLLYKPNVTNCILVFPNPAHDMLHIYADSEIIQAVRITDIAGRTIEKISSIEIKKMSIPISHLAAGIYHLQVLTDKNEYLQKVQVR